MAILIIDNFERVLNPNVVPIAMTESIVECSPAFLYKRRHFLDNPGSVIRMQMIRPALRIGSHLYWRVTHDVPKIVADKCAGKVVRCLRCVDNRRTYREEILQTLARPDQLRLDGLALSDVRPSPNKFECMAGLVGDNFEGILNPNIVTVSMTKTVLYRAASLFNQWSHFFQDPSGVLRMKMVGPGLGISGHFFGRITHYRAKIFANESASVVTRSLRRVNDSRTSGE